MQRLLPLAPVTDSELQSRALRPHLNLKLYNPKYLPLRVCEDWKVFIWRINNAGKHTLWSDFVVVPPWWDWTIRAKQCDFEATIP